MEAWRQYRYFTVPEPVEKKLSEREEDRRSTVISPASTATTLHELYSDPYGIEKSSGKGKIDSSPTQRPLEPSPTTHDVASQTQYSTLPPTPTSTSDEPVYVSFRPCDPADPQTWSFAYKTWVLSLLTFLTLSMTYASSASSSAEAGVKEEFGCGDVAATATTGIFLVGMGLGAMPAAPLSELYGRLPVYIVTIIIATLFELASALSPNIASLLTLRFLAGLVSSAPLSNAGGTLNDIGNPLFRTIAFPLFATCGFVGPILAPILGGFVAEDPRLGWRWCYYLCAIFNALAFLLVTLFMPETLAPALLKFKAIRLRRLTGDKRWRARVEDESLKAATVRALKRPFMMLAVEPVIQLSVLYLTIAYIVLYGSFSAYPIIFAAHGISPRHVGLTFIPVMIGFIVVFGGAALHYLRYRPLFEDAQNGKQRRGIFNGKIEPEERLIPMMLTGFLFPAGLFWLAWTSPARYSVWLPMISGFPFGIGLLSIFTGTMQYNIDAYGPFAASASAGSTIVRYCVPGVVILAFPAMYDKLGTQWATSLFAFMACILTPFPFVFYHFGRRVRERCKFTVRD